jgi:dCMP deaminase
MEISQREIDVFYLREAYKHAAEFSKDPIAQTGAILVSDNSIASLDYIVARGANRFPEGVEYTEERMKNKLLYIVHAETNAIFDAITNKIETKNLKMYCPWITCDNCAKIIIKAGIKEVIGHTGPDEFYKKIYPDSVGKVSKWTESIKAGLDMLNAAKISVRWVDGKVGGVEITFVNRKFQP